MLIVDKLAETQSYPVMSSTVTNLAQRETLASLARSEIERRITSGELAIGSKLNEQGLADGLGVSRGTVREAIRTLTDSGLIEMVANRGAFVRAVSIEEIANLYELRGAIFAMACGAAARHVAAEPDEASIRALIGSLERNMKEMEAAYRANDKAAYYALNIAFHRMLLEAARNPRAKAVYESLVKEMHLFRRRGLSVSPNIARSLEEHRAIVDAVEAGAEADARAAARRHIERGHRRFLAILDEGEGEEREARAS